MLLVLIRSASFTEALLLSIQNKHFMEKLEKYNKFLMEKHFILDYHLHRINWVSAVHACCIGGFPRGTRFLLLFTAINSLDLLKHWLFIQISKF